MLSTTDRTWVASEVMQAPKDDQFLMFHQLQSTFLRFQTAKTSDETQQDRGFTVNLTILRRSQATIIGQCSFKVVTGFAFIWAFFSNWNNCLQGLLLIPKDLNSKGIQESLQLTLEFSCLCHPLHEVVNTIILIRRLSIFTGARFGEASWRGMHMRNNLCPRVAKYI